jgi:6,7-dimethyl-8-ribityllumazine synthase
MVDAAADVLKRHGASAADLEHVRVPGAFELPMGCQRAIASGRIDAVLAFGCLIEGETEHFRLVADAATHGLMRVGLDTGVPVLHGILAVRDVDQAESRTGGEHGNRGAEVALAALRMPKPERTT